jgi:hypothetical protein
MRDIATSRSLSSNTRTATAGHATLPRPQSCTIEPAHPAAQHGGILPTLRTAPGHEPKGQAGTPYLRNSGLELVTQHHGLGQPFICDARPILRNSDITPLPVTGTVTLMLLKSTRAAPRVRCASCRP